MNNGLQSKEYTSEDLTGDILSARLSDGGWAITGTVSDVDVTAMAIQALAPQYADNAEVRNAIDAALSLLSARQLENGGFQSYGKENPESAAQVITALSSLGMDAAQTESFIKNGRSSLDAMLDFRLETGAFHIRRKIPQGTNYTAHSRSSIRLYHFICVKQKAVICIYSMKHPVIPAYRKPMACLPNMKTVIYRRKRMTV